MSSISFSSPLFSLLAFSLLFAPLYAFLTPSSIPGVNSFPSSFSSSSRSSSVIEPDTIHPSTSSPSVSTEFTPTLDIDSYSQLEKEGEAQEEYMNSDSGVETNLGREATERERETKREREREREMERERGRGRDEQHTETGNVIGLHGAESRFLSLSQLGRKEIWPRIVPVAGAYPGLTGKDLLAPEAQPSCGPGQFSFDFTDTEGPQLGTVALPGSELVMSCADPVVVVANNRVLGIELDEEVEVLVLIDRASTLYNSRYFYAFEAPDGAVVIRYFSEIPEEEGWSILGKVMYVTLPHVESTAKASGFLEEEEDD